MAIEFSRMFQVSNTSCDDYSWNDGTQTFFNLSFTRSDLSNKYIVPKGGPTRLRIRRGELLGRNCFEAHAGSTEVEAC